MGLKPLKDNWHCPHCDSPQVVALGGLTEDTGDEVSQYTECLDCRKSWREIYKLAGYIEQRKEDEDGDTT